MADSHSALTRRLIEEGRDPESKRVARPRDQRQSIVADWCARAFGIEHATNKAQRAIRAREEAEELYQAAMHEAGFPPDEARALAHRQTDHVHDRPAGTVAQELGGVGVTILALAQTFDLSADACEEAEIRRVLSKPLAHFARRNAEKNAAGFDLTGARSKGRAA